MSARIGFIGLGIMGQAMAANILKAGFKLTIFNRSSQKCAALAKAGASVATSSEQLAETCDTIILMLTGPEAVDAVLYGENGLLAADYRNKTIINMSTVPPAYSRELALKLTADNITLIDAPVSGSKIPAELGTLVILAAGPQAAITQLEPLFLSMASRVIFCGEAGSGSSMKLAINLLLGTMMEGLAESAHLAESSGLATETFLDAVGAGALACPLFKIKQQMLISNDYPPQFPFRHMAKDMQFVLQAAAETGASLPLGNKLAEQFDPNAPVELLDQDFAAVKTLLVQSK